MRILFQISLNVNSCWDIWEDIFDLRGDNLQNILDQVKDTRCVNDNLSYVIFGLNMPKSYQWIHKVKSQ
jgi:hypothetical protein